MQTPPKLRFRGRIAFAASKLFLTAAAAFGLTLEIAEGGRIKFIDGERHMFEHFARIVGGGGNALLFGYGVFRSVYEILRGTLDAYDGEKAEGDGKHLTVLLVGESAVHTVADDLGEILGVDVAVGTKLAGVENTGVEDEGIYDLKDGGGKIVSGAFRMLAAAEIRGGNVALENIDVAFSAVENHLFLNDGDTLGLLCSAHAGADLHGDLDIHGNADLIKAPIEGDVIHVNICAEDLCAFGTDCGSAFQ